MPAQVAVAIVSWNTRDLLARALKSLEQAADQGRVEVWVVDNGSTDGSRELVRDGFAWVNLLQPADNLGFGRAVNLVALSTQTPWVAPANADIALQPGALEALLDAAGAAPDAGAIAPRLRLPDGTTQHSVYAFPTLTFALLFNSGAAGLIPSLADHLCLEGHWDPERAREVDWAIGAFILVRREAWDIVHGFDERQWMYAEDLDLGWRLASAGWRTRYVPDAVVDHESGASARQAWGDQVADRWMVSTYAWMHRRRGLAMTRLIAIVNVLGAVVRWLSYSALACVAPDRWGGRRDLMRAWVARHRQGLRRPAPEEPL